VGTETMPDVQAMVTSKVQLFVCNSTLH